jgi:putative copper export protein
MPWVDLVLRWLHILSAVALAGGVIFWRCALLPATESLPEVTRAEIGAAVRSRWSKIVMATSGLLLVTGLVNFMFVIKRFDVEKSYHMMFGIKFLLSLGVFLLSAFLAGRTAAADKLRRNERQWLNINVLLVVAVICLGGVLRSTGRQPKSTQSSRPDRPADQLVIDSSASLTVAASGE